MSLLWIIVMYLVALVSVLSVIDVVRAADTQAGPRPGGSS